MLADLSKAKVGRAALLVGALSLVSALLGVLRPEESLAIRLVIAIAYVAITALCAWIGLRPASRHPFLTLLPPIFVENLERRSGRDLRAA